MHVATFIVLAALMTKDVGATTPEPPVTQMEAITQKCDVSKDRLVWKDGAVHWIDPRTLTYGQTMCLLSELKRSGLPVDLGFVGNNR